MIIDRILYIKPNKYFPRFNKDTIYTVISQDEDSVCVIDENADKFKMPRTYEHKHFIFVRESAFGTLLY